MVEVGPWLTIVGIGEDGPAGLPTASLAAIDGASFVIGAARHLALLPTLPNATIVAWPIPFDIQPLLDRRGQATVMLASGDPFWFGAGSVVTGRLAAGEWIAHPAPSTFALAAARLGWRLEDCVCLGLHAAPLTRLRPHLAPGQRVIVLVRDGDAVLTLADYLSALGFGAATLTVMEAIGGPRERVRTAPADDVAFTDIVHPVAVGIETAGDGDALPCASGLADDWFDHDGQISKRPIRALTLSALAPRPGETLWDIGAGSGSIGIEWLLSHPSLNAVAFERNAERAARIRSNAMALGVDRLTVIEGAAPDCLPPPESAMPDAVFIGGGLSSALLDRLSGQLAPGTRIVANAVTLESEALLTTWHRARGGTLLRIDLAEAVPIGTRRGWRASFPVVQWSVTL